MACKLSLMDMVKRVMERLGTLRSTQEDRERMKTAVSGRDQPVVSGIHRAISSHYHCHGDCRGEQSKLLEYHRCGHPLRQDFPALFL